MPRELYDAARQLDKFLRSGAIAQLGERLHGMQARGGSIPLNTKFTPDKFGVYVKALWAIAQLRALAWHARVSAARSRFRLH